MGKRVCVYLHTCARQISVFVRLSELFDCYGDGIFPDHDTLDCIESVLLWISRPLEYDNGSFESSAFCVKVCMRFLVACYLCVRRHSRGMGMLHY